MQWLSPINPIRNQKVIPVWDYRWCEFSHVNTPSVLVWSMGKITASTSFSPWKIIVSKNLLETGSKGLNFPGIVLHSGFQYGFVFAFLNAWLLTRSSFFARDLMSRKFNRATWLQVNRQAYFAEGQMTEWNKSHLGSLHKAKWIGNWFTQFSKNRTWFIHWFVQKESTLTKALYSNPLNEKGTSEKKMKRN